MVTSVLRPLRLHPRPATVEDDLQSTNETNRENQDSSGVELGRARWDYGSDESRPSPQANRRTIPQL